MKNNDRSLLNPVRARTFPERHPDGLIGVDATSSSGPHDRAESGEQVGAPVGSEAAGDFAIGGCGTEFAFAAVVVRADFGMVEEGEQVNADLAVSLTQSPAIAVGRRQGHHRVEFALHPLALLT